MSIYDDNYLEPKRPEPPMHKEVLLANCLEPKRPEPPMHKEVLLAKVFCISDCDDLQHLINHFLERLDHRFCYKPELITSLGCKCACEKETVVLFYRKIRKEHHGCKDIL